MKKVNVIKLIMISCVVLFTLSFGFGLKNNLPLAKAAQKAEYKVIFDSYSNTGDTKPLEELLNDMARKGWRLERIHKHFLIFTKSI